MVHDHLPVPMHHVSTLRPTSRHELSLAVSGLVLPCLLLFLASKLPKLRGRECERFGTHDAARRVLQRDVRGR